jgi:hypothetical protein
MEDVLSKCSDLKMSKSLVTKTMCNDWMNPSFLKMMWFVLQ